MIDASIQVTCHQQQILPGRIVTDYTFEWLGPKTGFAVVDEDYPLADMPWPLRVVDPQYGPRPASVCVRCDGPLRLLVPFQIARYHWRRWARWWTRRIVYTAAVWGLAQVSMGEEPSWSNLGRKRN